MNMDVFLEYLQSMDFTRYLEILEGLPYYPYSVIGAGALLLLLLILLAVVSKRRRPASASPSPSPKRKAGSRPPVRGIAVDGLSPSGEIYGETAYKTSPQAQPLPPQPHAAPPTINPAPFQAAARPQASQPASPLRAPRFVPQTPVSRPAAQPGPVLVKPPVPPVQPQTPIQAPIHTPPPSVPHSQPASRPQPAAQPGPVLTKPLVPPVQAPASVASAPVPVPASTVEPRSSAPEPPKPAPAPETPRAKSSPEAKACQDKFQELYIDMYLSLGLMSDFEGMRREIGRRLSDEAAIAHSVVQLGMAPSAVALTSMSDVVGEMLQKGEEHIGRGLLSIRGQELLSVYRHALNTMQGKGFASRSDVQAKLDFMDQKIRELG